jgi:hypothetical protein
MIGQMQGKFQLIVVPDIGHMLHEVGPLQVGAFKNVLKAISRMILVGLLKYWWNFGRGMIDPYFLELRKSGRDKFTASFLDVVLYLCLVHVQYHPGSEQKAALAFGACQPPPEPDFKFHPCDLDSDTTKTTHG